MKFITNIENPVNTFYPPRSPMINGREVYVTTREDIEHLLLGRIIDDPLPPPNSRHTVESLRAQGLVGIYDPEGGENVDVISRLP